MFKLEVCFPGMPDSPSLLPPRLSPSDSDPGSPWAVDPLTEGAVQELWPPCEPAPLCDPLEYRTLFDNKGFIFNISEQTNGCVGQTLKAPRPMTLPVSPTKEQLATLLNPSSPGHEQLAAVIRVQAPPQLTPTLALLRAVEMDPGVAERALASPRGRFLRAATDLHSRLVDLDTETGFLLYEGFMLRHGFQDLLTNTDYLLRQNRTLQQDLQDVLYLNDLLWMLQGRLERVSRRRWPFLDAHADASSGSVNLIV